MRLNRILALILCVAGPALLSFSHLEGAGAAKVPVVGEPKTVADISPAQRAATIKRNTIKGSFERGKNGVVEATGRLYAYHVDREGAKNAAPDRFAVYVSQTKAIPLHLPEGTDRKLLTGQQVSATGIQSGDGALEVSGIEVLAPPPAQLQSTGQTVRRVAVLNINFNSAPTQGWTNEQLENWVFDDERSVSEFYFETSYGKVSLDGDVFGRLTLPYAPDCTDINGDRENQWASDARAMLAGQNVNLASYDHLIYVYPRVCSAFNYSGFASGPGAPAESWIATDSAAVTAPVITHELGHNLGLLHANRIYCHSDGVVVPISTDCDHVEYGDESDVMGNVSAYRSFGGYHRARAGFLPPTNVTAGSTGNEYTIRDVSNSADPGVTQLLEIPRPGGLENRNWLYVDFRRPAGLFGQFSQAAAITQGASVRISGRYSEFPSYYWYGPQLVDSSPVAAEVRHTARSKARYDDHGDSALEVGESLYDPVGNLSITVTAINGADLTVSVTAGAPPAPDSVVSINGGTLQVAAGPGVANDIWVGDVGSNLMIADYSAGITAPSSCTQVDPVRVACPKAGLVDAYVDMGDRNDMVSSTSTLPVTVSGGAGEDDFEGGQGDDLFSGGAGNDGFDGGGGTDTMSYADRTDAVTIATATVPELTNGLGYMGGVTGESDFASYDDVERIEGGSGSDEISLASTDFATNGSRAAIGGGGNDHLTGGPFADTLDGGPGDDVLYSQEASSDSDYCGDGVDTVSADSVDMVAGDCEFPTILPRSSVKLVNGKLTFSGAPAETHNAIVAGLPGSWTVTDPGATALVAGPGCFKTSATQAQCLGTVTSARFDLGDQADRVFVPASFNAPTVYNGGLGDDTLIAGGTGADQFNGGLGKDAVSYSPRSGSLYITTSGSGSADGDVFGADIEVIEGGSGADSLLDYGGGPHELRGGGGNDSIYGFDGNDVIYGGFGNDQLDGGGDTDSIAGDLGDDAVTYSNRSASVTAAADGEPASGEPGENDTIDVDVERLIGGSGGDFLSSAVAAEGFGGNDTITDVEEQHGGQGNDTLIAPVSGAPAELHGDDGIDQLIGNSGDVKFDGGLGGDTLTPGTGFQRLDYGMRWEDISLSNNGQPDDGAAGEGDSVGAGFDELILGSGDDTVRFANANWDLYVSTGEGSNDIVTGTRRDAIYGGSGNDYADGGVGTDYFALAAGDDTVSYINRSVPVNINLTAARGGQSGENDAFGSVENVFGGSGDDTITGKDGLISTLHGGDGSDTITGMDAAEQIFGDAGNDAIDGGYETDGSGDFIYPGAGDDNVSAGGGFNWIDGGTESSGADAVSGGPEVDLLDYSQRADAVSLLFNGAPDDGVAGEGDNVDLSIDNLVLGAGNDVVDASAAFDSFTIDGGLGDDQLTTGDGMDDLYGNDGNDTLDGGPNQDYMYGGPGSDTVSYANRANPVDVSINNSFHDGEAGEEDVVYLDNENITGGSGADVLTGNGQANVLTGNAGGDLITGGAGVDSLSGGDGADTLKSRDSGPDTDQCGDGADVVSGDTVDSIAADCETKTTLTTVITAGPSGPTNVASPLFSFVSDEPAATFECSNVASGSADNYAPCASGVMFGPLPDGAYVLKVRARDASGVYTQSIAARSYTVDTVKPAPPVITQPATNIYTTSGQPPISGTAEPGSTVKLYHATVDLFGTDQAAAGSGAWSHVWTSTLSGATHPFHATATDAAGNTSLDSAVRQITVDQTPPDTTIASPAADGSVFSGTSVPFSFTSNEPGATFQCKVDGGTYASCSTGFAPALIDGQHTISVRAVDQAGNTDGSPASRLVWVSNAVSQLNKLAPVTQTSSVSLSTTGTTDWVHWGTSGTSLTPDRKSGANVFSQSATAIGSVTRVTSGLPSFSWSGGTPTASSGGTTTGLAAANGIGNGFQFTVPALSTQQRELKLYVGVTNTTGTLGLALNDGTASVTDSTVSQASGTKSVVFTIRFRANSPGKQLTVSWQQATSGTGARVILESATLTTAADVTAPTTTITSGPANGSTITSSTATFGFSASESGSTFQCSVDGAAFAACTTTFTTPALSPGAHTFDVRSIDAAGNVESRPPRRTFTKQ